MSYGYFSTIYGTSRSITSVIETSAPNILKQLSHKNDSWSIYRGGGPQQK